MSKTIFTYETEQGKTVKIREAAEFDAESILVNAADVLEDAPYMISTVEDVKELTIADVQQMIEMYSQNPNYVQFIAEVDNKLVGAIDFKNGSKEKISHQGSFGMTVLPEYRNCGVGGALLEQLIDWAKNNNEIEKVCLEVMEGNIGAIKLYKRKGFLEEGRKIKGVKNKNEYQDLLIMALFV
ncbi:GNAT family N-acetyltransferase [Halobacillus yeomjeoni]|uniref:GNAT family N-acetyltransferase n=1 Tax=Halobacillus yeomjeoni TaxID=311194 RepID=A0A931HT28_9BACI|nr:GNAT family N-acetyltransferase [Halobacillus yeomjeoni]MBH0229102.1 GNAT family N-acetyltransferase [Halobacillus yeomjeoni]